MIKTQTQNISWTWIKWSLFQPHKSEFQFLSNLNQPSFQLVNPGSRCLQRSWREFWWFSQSKNWIRN
jgi:hypothetical protein